MFESDNYLLDLSPDELMHYGVKRRSGRYPWGSGNNSFQRSEDFLARIDELKKSGMAEKEIAKAIGLTSTQLRTQASLAKNERRQIAVATAKDLQAKGMNTSEIARQMGYKNESSVRSLLNEGVAERQSASMKAADFLRAQVDAKGMVDVGKNVNLELNITAEKMKEALYILELEGYQTYKGRMPQVTNPGKFTTLSVLTKPGAEHKEIFEFGEVKSVTDYVSHDDGQTFQTYKYPTSLDSKRIKVRYDEEGGTEKDGLVEIRRNVKDVSIGEANYSQVRILVDGTHYIKGMAVYSDNMPPGVDVVFNTNKKKGTPLMSDNKKDSQVLKPIKEGDNPFGSLIKPGGQSYYTDANGKQQMSVINKRADEGDWGRWADKLPSQFLGKQSVDLINKQLTLTKNQKIDELNDILSLTNPTVKKRLLESFAETADADAMHLKSAALPRQKYQVIIPVPSLKDNEVYAPNYNDGEMVALIRFPHGGTFEIPILKVNNKQKDATAVIGKSPLDAVAINKKNADRLSGADFDGDTAMVIPTNSKVKINSTPALKELEGFDTKLAYPERTGMKYMTNTNIEMGKISNLITDMTLKGATDPELAKAVKHSMVVIDAEKHKLDYTKSYIDNDIATLKKKYQGEIGEDGKYHEGAGTLLSRSKSPVNVSKRVGQPKIDPETGKLVYNEKPEFYEVTKKDPVTGERIGTGVIKERTTSSKKMLETDDARTLISKTNTKQENLYADYANTMKALANTARKEFLNTPNLTYSPEAKKTYASEVKALNDKLLKAEKNAPKERQAQAIANSRIKAIQQSNPEMTKEEKKKTATNEINRARIQVGAKRESVTITDREWEAIQAGAITNNALSKMLKYTDTDVVKSLATPRDNVVLTSAKTTKMNAMIQSGKTISEVAEALGVPRSTINSAILTDREKGGAV